MQEPTDVMSDGMPCFHEFEESGDLAGDILVRFDASASLAVSAGHLG